MAEKGTTRKQQKADSSERILRSTVECVGRKGYERTSVAEIAEGAGVTAGLVISRFGSKEELLAAAYKLVLSECFSEIVTCDDAIACLTVVFDGIKNLSENDSVTFFFMRAVLLSYDMPETCEGVRRAHFDECGLRERVEAAQEQGILPQGDPFNIFSVYALGIVTHLGTCMAYGLVVPSVDIFLSSIGYESEGPAARSEAASRDEQDGESACSKVVEQLLLRHTELSSVIDLQTGRYQLVSSRADFPVSPTGDIQPVFDLSIDQVARECRAEYIKNMNVAAIREKLEGVEKFSFQAFYENEDGSLCRKLNVFYALDDERRYVLALREDTTDEYRAEQATAKAREEVSASLLQTSDYLEQMIHRHSRRDCVLVVEDGEINREILESILSSDFDVVLACDGEEGIRVLEERADAVDLVLLDVYMPVCDGFEFLERTRKVPKFASIPVIVATGSNNREDEERCLRLGATDFVTKPYQPESLLSRIKGAIRMNASASSMAATEFDSRTGLYAHSAFLFHAARELAQGGKHALAVLDVNDFGMLNSIYGEHLADEALKHLANQLVLHMPGALISRASGRFYVLAPEGQPLRSEKIMEYISAAREKSPIPGIRLKVGIVQDVDGSVPVSMVCDRAKLAAQSIEDDAHVQVAIYDDAIEHKKAASLKMLADFEPALEQKQFVTWAQPKVDSSTGEIIAAEALVRWFDGDGNFVSPGEFIPLFEQQGCIRALDEYIFRTVCEYQKERLDRNAKVVSISVNLSRSSLFSGGAVERYRSIADEVGVPCSLVPLEITESAATADALIKDICEEFVNAGFCLHMDDFGTGYSSLSSLSELPFKVLKIDKSLVDKIGDVKGEIVLRNAIETAQDLGMRVVAEGVEEQSQIDHLSRLGCNIIQGYFYSPPKNLTIFSELLDAEAPFADRLAGSVVGTDYPSLSSSEFRRFLKLARGTHEIVRMLDFQKDEFYLADEKGVTQIQGGHCYDVWGRGEQCANCTSRAVLETKGAKRKFELMGDDAYIVYSKYFEVDNRPVVVELVDSVGSGTVHGLEGTPTFMDAVTTACGEIYRDTQLGTLNRRFIDERRADLSKVTAIAYIDVDKLKETNDKLGHSAGDELLHSVSDAVHGCMRDTDYLIRMGGDEFIAAFTGMRECMLRRKLEEIHDAVSAAGASVSIGGCLCKGVTDEVIAAADAAMYAAKEHRGEIVIIR